MTDDESFESHAAAAALIQQTTSDTRRSLDTQVPQLYGAWGVAWLVGLGGMWLAVRGQHPFVGPTTATTILLVVLLTAAVAVTIAYVARASRGLHGQSASQGRIFGFAWLIGYATFFTLVGALGHQGASATVLGLVSATGPLLVTSLVYFVGAAIWLDWPMLGMGIWLAIVVSAGVWTGPVTVLLVDALAGGGGFLVMTGYLAVRRRR